MDIVLSLIFNQCINNGYFPQIWKQGKILPIAKKKGTREVDNFRPISLLSNIGKLFERVLATPLNIFCEDLGIIPTNQFGFKRGNSTEHALLLFQDKVIQNLRNKTCTVCLDIDLEKAFDSLWHQGLIFKLLQLNFPLWITKIIFSFR